MSTAEWEWTVFVFVFGVGVMYKFTEEVEVPEVKWPAGEHRALDERKWTHRGLNPGPSACKADALPLRYAPTRIT